VTKEEELVVNPLVQWFQNQRADWKFYRPRHGTSSTGWDLEARRKNLDLLVEAKFIDGPFLSSFAGLVVAPLANRPQHFMKTKYRGWSYGVCWAIGTSRDQRGVYQILLDYLARNQNFWEHYCKDLRLKYVFFVKDGKVAKVPFTDLLTIAVTYGKKANGKTLKERRAFAEALMRKYEYL
jgi:hypothetical protein